MPPGRPLFFDAAVRATDFLCHFYETASAELARNAICPSHYMGVVEMYRATGNPRYLELSKNLIDIRGMVENGTDDNQDRIPFREQYRAMGHAVRANYLYAGVADVYAETGEEQLMKNLTSIWNDIVTRKMYVTGACGALYDGTSPDGTCYEPDSIQKVHQSYGRPYQLPNSTAHNETCANIGNMLFNWRMLEVTGAPQPAPADRVRLVAVAHNPPNQPLHLTGCKGMPGRQGHAVPPGVIVVRKGIIVFLRHTRLNAVGHLTLPGIQAPKLCVVVGCHMIPKPQV